MYIKENFVLRMISSLCTGQKKYPSRLSPLLSCTEKKIKSHLLFSVREVTNVILHMMI